MAKPAPLAIQNLLRLGTIELCQGGASYGVVNDMVRLASKNRKFGRLKGLVNAVLRKMATEAPRDWPRLPVPKMPGWLRGPLVEAWGVAAVAAMERAHAAGAALDLTARQDPAQVARATGGKLLPTGSVRVEDPGQVSHLPGYDVGAWWAQDAAAALPAQLVAGQRVLDLCAAPGGKTMQLAARGKEVTAVDRSKRRVARLRDNLARTALKADLHVADAREISGHWDTVLLDAPCSATGTLRRHPDLPYAKDGSDFAALIALQSELLDHALGLVAPGGQLVYCTCSLLPDEGEVQIDQLLARHPTLCVDAHALSQPWLEATWRTKNGGLRLRPDYWADDGGMDGFYIAALRKPQ